MEPEDALHLARITLSYPRTSPVPSRFLAFRFACKAVKRSTWLTEKGESHDVTFVTWEERELVKSIVLRNGSQS